MDDDLMYYAKELILSMKFTGLWSDSDHFFKKSRTMLISNLIFFCYLVLSALPILIQLCYAENLEDFLSVGFILLEYITSLTKLTTLIRKWSLIKSLIRDSRAACFETPRNRRASNDATFYWWNMRFRAMLLSIVGTVGLWAPLPFITNMKKEHKLVLRAWYPYDYTETPYYELSHLQQLGGVLCVGAIHSVVDGLATALMAYVAIQCDNLAYAMEHSSEITKQKLREIGNFDVETDREVFDRELNNNFINNLRHHKAIIRFSKKSQEILSTVSFSEYVACIPSLCITLYQISVVKFMGQEFVCYITYFMGVTTQLANYCWMGNEMMVKSEAIPLAAYKSNWVDAPVRYKKNLTYFIHRTQKPIQMFAIGFFHLSVEAFLKIIRMSWSYFTVLRQMQTH